jgi:hypothetical protein
VARWAGCTECMADGAAMVGGDIVVLHLIQI